MIVKWWRKRKERKIQKALGTAPKWKIKQCPNCKGAGGTLDIYGFPDASFFECARCHGAGTIEVYE